MELHNGLLKTPCGDILIVGENAENIPFYVKENIFDCPYEFENAAGEIKIINTNTIYSLVIDAASLKYNKKYRIYMPDTKLDYGDSDERTECVSGYSNGYCIAIGAHLPNDDEKMEQAYDYSEKMGFLEQHFIKDPPSFDESKFTEYDVEMLEDRSGFSFRLIDDKCSEITFEVAWIAAQTGEEEYEAAVQFWTI